MITAAPSVPTHRDLGGSLKKKALAHPPKPPARYFLFAIMTLSHPIPLQHPNYRSHKGWGRSSRTPPPSPGPRWDPQPRSPAAQRQTHRRAGQRDGTVTPPGSPRPRGGGGGGGEEEGRRGGSFRREQHPALRTLPPICIRRRSRGRLTSPPGSPDSLRRVPPVPQSAVSCRAGTCPERHPGTGPTGLPFILFPFCSVTKSPHTSLPG